MDSWFSRSRNLHYLPDLLYHRRKALGLSKAPAYVPASPASGGRSREKEMSQIYESSAATENRETREIPETVSVRIVPAQVLIQVKARPAALSDRIGNPPVSAVRFVGPFPVFAAARETVFPRYYLNI